MTVIEKLDMNVKQANADFQAIKSKIVDRGVSVADGTRTADYASKVDEVYEAGRKSHYDEFWDSYQNNGEKTNYRLAFSGNGWTTDTFKPKYNICPTNVNAYMMFYFSGISGDLVKILEDCGVVMDLSGLNGWAQYVFASSKLTRLGKLDLSHTSMLASTFSDTPLHTIDELIVSAITEYSNAFSNCASLENLAVGGVIGKNGFNVQWCPLSHESLMSIINALKDNSGTNTWNTITLGADNIAKLTQEERDIMEQKHWEYT